MNIKSTIATIAIVSAATALSANAFAGELYGGLESDNSTSTLSASSVMQVTSAPFGEGEVYAAANNALDSANGSAAPQQAYVTTVAVGGELGAPIRQAPVFAADTALAE